MAEHEDRSDDADAQDSAPPPISRRALLAAGAGGLVGAAGASTLAAGSEADPQGGLGTSSDPLQAAYLDELRGPITEFSTPITQLVDHRVAEDSANISPADETLVFRYDPNSTV